MSVSWPVAGALFFAIALVPYRADSRRPATHVVEIQGMAFYPEELRAQRGDTIVWVNQDVVPHTATAMDSSSWATGMLKQGERARWVADRSGSRPYFCELHPTMKGTLIVR